MSGPQKSSTSWYLLVIIIVVTALGILITYFGDYHFQDCNSSLTIVKDGTSCPTPGPK